jgi:hypothetical protein
MIRTLLRTPTLARATPRTVVAGRSVTTRAPTNSSGTPSTDIAGTLAPGEEIDPQRMSYFPRLGRSFLAAKCFKLGRKWMLTVMGQLGQSTDPQ